MKAALAILIGPVIGLLLLVISALTFGDKP